MEKKISYQPLSFENAVNDYIYVFDLLLQLREKYSFILKAALINEEIDINNKVSNNNLNIFLSTRPSSSNITEYNKQSEIKQDIIELEYLKICYEYKFFQFLNFLIQKQDQNFKYQSKFLQNFKIYIRSSNKEILKKKTFHFLKKDDISENTYKHIMYIYQKWALIENPNAKKDKT